MLKFKHMLISSAVLFALALFVPLSNYAQSRERFQRQVSFSISEGRDNNLRYFDMDVGLRNEQQATDQCVTTTGTALCTYQWSTVPAGRRAVITYVGGKAKLPSGQMVEIDIYTEGRSTLDGISSLFLIFHPFVPVNKVAGSKDWYVLSEMTELYATPETYIYALARRSATTGVANITVIISGYYEEVSSTTTPQ